jgi:hypothetical protein
MRQTLSGDYSRLLIFVKAFWRTAEMAAKTAEYIAKVWKCPAISGAISSKKWRQKLSIHWSHVCNKAIEWLAGILDQIAV